MSDHEPHAAERARARLYDQDGDKAPPDLGAALADLVAALDVVDGRLRGDDAAGALAALGGLRSGTGPAERFCEAVNAAPASVVGVLPTVGMDGSTFRRLARQLGSLRRDLQGCAVRGLPTTAAVTRLAEVNALAAEAQGRVGAAR